MTSRELPELRHASKLRRLEGNMKKKAYEQDRKSSARNRQMDRRIYMTTKDLTDIQTCTNSPFQQRSATSQTSATYSDTDSTIRDSHRQRHRQRHRQQQPLQNRRRQSRSQTAIRSTDSELDDDGFVSDSGDTRLVHVGTRTRRNLLLSQRLSYLLSVQEERRRGRNSLYPSDPLSSGPCHLSSYRPISSKSMDNLQKAATVLKFTRHERNVQRLLGSVSLSKDNESSYPRSYVNERS